MQKMIVALLLTLSAGLLGGCAAGNLSGGSPLPGTSQFGPMGSVGGGPPGGPIVHHASVGGGPPSGPIAHHASVGGGLPSGHRMRHPASVGGGPP
jgi:hypothetical protein